jgi:hypothetical protein
MSTARALAACALVAACTPQPSELVTVRNSCTRDADCHGNVDDAQNAATCDIVRKRCEHQRVLAPYDMVLQVTPGRDRAGLVPRYTLPVSSVEERVDDAVLEVPLAVTADGAIRETADGTLVSAALIFEPTDVTPGYPVASETFYTLTKVDDDLDNLHVPIAPGTRYDVRIQPLGDFSKDLPPARRTFSSEDERLDHTYPALQPVTLRVVAPGDLAFESAHVRLVDAASGAVISSTNVSGSDGVVTLRADPDDLARGYEVLLGVSRTSPWLVTIRADPKRLVAGSNGPPTLTVPALPEEVLYEGRVAMPDGVFEQLVEPTELVFVSSFPVPQLGALSGDRDWCRTLRGDDKLPAFACAAEISTTTDPDGTFSISLLPGSYSVYARPSGTSPAGQEVRTVLLQPVLVQSPGGGAPQSGQQIDLLPAVPYAGRVVSPTGRSGPDVTVRAEALDPGGDLDNVGLVARYARTIETVTDERGEFSLGIDLGYYDLSLRPAPETGFAWTYVTNRAITQTEADGAMLGELTLQSPVRYAGTVRDDRGATLSGATVDAYAIVGAPDGTNRAVQVGSAQTASDGSFELLLPPRVDGAVSIGD